MSAILIILIFIDELVSGCGHLLTNLYYSLQIKYDAKIVECSIKRHLMWSTFLNSKEVTLKYRNKNFREYICLKITYVNIVCILPF